MEFLVPAWLRMKVDGDHEGGIEKRMIEIRSQRISIRTSLISVGDDGPHEFSRPEKLYRLSSRKDDYSGKKIIFSDFPFNCWVTKRK